MYTVPLSVSECLSPELGSWDLTVALPMNIKLMSVCMTHPMQMETLAFESNNQKEHNVPFEAVTLLFASVSHTHGCDVTANADYNGII